jgi:hypothetical protein
MRDTIDMAREAGLYRQTHYLMSNPVQTRYSYEGSEEQLKTFEALVRADERSVEREACAKMVEELNEIGHSYGLENRIRARGNT